MQPTPTPLPSIESPIDLSSFDAWEFSDYAIQFWNKAPSVTTAFQAIVLVAIVFFILNSLYKYAQAISVNDNG